jgi:predicted nucleic acid-binding Zn ribbon protein
LTEVHYCYRCGRHVGAGAGKCWYCTAPTRRVLRSEKRCPFCDQPIRPKAVKCHHCGEFLDGRNQQSAAAAKQPGPTFVIERAIIQTDRAELPEGANAPRIEAPAQAQLHAQPQARIEGPGGNRQPQALPAPEAAPDEPMDVSLEPKSLVRANPSLPAEPGAADPRSASKEIVKSTGADGREIAVRDFTQAPALLTSLFKKSKPKAEEKSPDTIDVRPESDEDKYRLCTVCQTEILVEDNFCFHCGQKYHASDYDAKEKPREHSAAVHYSLIAILASFQVVAPIMIEANIAADLAKLGYAIAAASIPLLCLLSFFWKRTSVNQALSIILLVASIAASLFFWPK